MKFRPRAEAFGSALRLLAFLLSALSSCVPLTAQTNPPTQVNQTQQLVFAGLRSASAKGQFNSVKSDSAGNLFLLLDQGDGVRILKTDGAAKTILAQALLGATGDIGVALALSPSGIVYVTGATTSTTLTATPTAAIPTRTDASTNSFLAAFDSDLVPVFVTFTGGSRIAASALAVTADAVFVTGSLFSATLPVTPNAFQQTPGSGSTQSGFVEKFSSDGTALLYATYLTGADGNTTPRAITADPSDASYIVGSTAAPGYPTANALVPTILSNPSGFLTKLSPAGDAIVFSTFIPGPGLTSITIDTSGRSLLLSGAVALGQFPIQTVFAPIAPLPYQSLLEIPLDGASVQDSILLAPGSQSFVAQEPAGPVWTGQSLTAAILPALTLSSLGDILALRITTQYTVDQAARFGGLPNANPSFTSLPSILTSIALDPAGDPLIAGSVQPTASSSLLSTETYDLPLTGAFTPALPSTIRSAELSADTCTGSLCAGAAGYLARLDPATPGPSLALSVDDAPFVVLRNLGSADANNLTLTATGASISSSCLTTLPSRGECSLLLTGTGSTLLTVSAANASPQTVSVPKFTSPSSTIVVSPKELDFGIQTSVSPPALRTLTVTNLGTTSQTFNSAILLPPRTLSPFTESSSDCPLATDPGLMSLAPSATCTITLAFASSVNPASDVYLREYWQIGSRDVLLTGYSQAAALSVSANEIDFGTQYPTGPRLPRFLHLSNASTFPIAHTPVTLPASAPFVLADGCPSLIPPQFVCTLRLDYVPATTPSEDSLTLTLDPDGLGQNLTVLITGQALSAPGNGNLSNPNLIITPANITFSAPVAVTAVSAEVETLTITNSGGASLPLVLSVTGDFFQRSSCTAELPAGRTCTVSITFAPSQPGERLGLLVVSSGSASSPTYIPLTGSATSILPAENGAISFGGTILNQPLTLFYPINHPFPTFAATTTGPYTVTLIPNLGFGPGNPTNFAPSATAVCPDCFLALRFDPTASGLQPGTLTLSSDPLGSRYTIALTGNGLPATGLILTPPSETFGTVPLSSASPPFLFTLTNLTASGQPVTLTSPVSSGDFALNSAPTGGQSCAGTLPYSASCSLSLTFAPTLVGFRTGSLTIPTSAGSVSAALSGFATSDPGLALLPTALIFNNVPGPTSTRQTITLTNTGPSTLQIANPGLTSNAFAVSTSCTAVAPAAACTLTVTYTSGADLATDILTIPVTSSTGTTTYTVPLTGAYTVLSAGLEITPAQAAFGPSDISTLGLPRQYTIQNLTPKSVTLNLSTPRQFALINPPCLSLAPSTSCTFTTQFIPLTTADTTGSVTARATPADGSAPLETIVYLDGFGLSQSGPLTLTGPIQSGILNFGQVASGHTGSIILTLSNNNATPITIRRITSAPPFLSTTTCGLTLTFGQSCTVTLTYSPTNQVPTGTSAPQSTPDIGLLTIESDASSSPDVINLTGQGGPVASPTPVNNSPIASYTLSQGSLTFPLTPIGVASPPQTVIILNSGTAPLHLLSAFTTADFAFQTPCATILPAATCTLTVTSTPQSPGPHISALQLASDSTASLDFISLLALATTSTISVSPRSLAFGPVLVAASSTLPVQIANTGSGPVVFTSISTTGDYAPSGTCPASGDSLSAGQSCTIHVLFTPTQTGPRPGVLSIATNATASPYLVPLSGAGVQSQLIVSPLSLAFGSIVLGASSELPLSLTNNGTAPITNLALAATGDYILTAPCPAMLAPAASCTAQVTFTPTALGPLPGTLTITSSDPSSPITVPLSGTGIQSQLSVTPSNLSFGSIVLGTSSQLVLTLTNNGAAPVTSLNFTITGDYALTASCPATLAPAASCTVQVTFTPTALGPRPGTLIITSPGPPSPITVPLSGTGIQNGTGQNGSFTLTVNGASTATVTITAPASATYSLALTPVGGYTGPVALTCTPVDPGIYSTCSIQPAILTLAGAPQSAVATITTTSDTSLTRTPRTLTLILAATLLLFIRRRRRLCLLTLFATIGCGSGINKSIQYTPVGAYQYQVTAVSTTGPPIPQTVTLNLVVKSPF